MFLFTVIDIRLSFLKENMSKKYDQPQVKSPRRMVIQTNELHSVYCPFLMLLSCCCCCCFICTFTCIMYVDMLCIMENYRK